MRVLAGRILGTVDALVLQSGEERFGHRIIVAYPGAADGMPDAIFLQRTGKLPGRVIAAAVGVENSAAPARGKLRAAISMAFSMSGVL